MAVENGEAMEHMTDISPCDGCGRTPTEVEQANRYSWLGGFNDDGTTWRKCPACVEGFRIGRADDGHPRVIVQHVSGWRLDWTEGARTADVSGPDGSPVDCVQVTAWDWAPVEGGPSRMAGTAPTDRDLCDALAAWVQDNAEAHGLPGLV